MLRKLAFLLLLSGSALLAFAQQPTAGLTVQTIAGQAIATETVPSPPDPETVITPTSNQREGLIHLDIAAEDGQGKSLGDLSAKDLTLLEDGAAAKILSFHRSDANTQDESLSEVDLVLDEVDLSPVQFARVKQQTMNFLRSNGGALAEPVSIVWVKAEGIYTTTSPTTDGNALAEDIATGQVTISRFYPDQHRGGDLREAEWTEVLRAVYALALKGRNKPGRKAIVWMGFGWPTVGTEIREKGGAFPILVELSTRLREARMVLYEITPWVDPQIPVKDKIPLIDYKQHLGGLRSPADPEMSYAILHFALPVLAIQSGGQVFDHTQDIAGDILRSIHDASDFYTISLDPPHAAQPDEFHDLRVVTGPGAVPLRTLSGYYNQPVYYDEPRDPQRRLTVAELEQVLEADHGEHDGELAKTLNGLELTERLSTALLTQWQQRLHGKDAKAALTALADESVFLAPPAAEVSSQAAPDSDAQQQIALRAVKYLDTAVPMLPDFSANATTLKYEQPEGSAGDAWKTAPPNRALMQTVAEHTTLLYRNGHEERIVDKQVGKRTTLQSDLNYRGIFGPLLGFVLEDVRHGKNNLVWSRWERTGQGTMAVFHYSVGAKNPKYDVLYCCLVGGQRFQTLPEHHGELSIDPTTGEILRITVESEPEWIRETDLTPLRPVLFSNMVVEYGPVQIGGQRYICPIHSVVMTRERTVRKTIFWDAYLSLYGPYQTLMNDTTYTDFHKFTSEMTILPGFDEVRDQKNPPGNQSSPQ